MSSALGDIVTVGSLGLIDGDDLTGQNAGDAARDASKAQIAGIEKQIDFMTDSRDIAREDLSPFTAFGVGKIDDLNALLTSDGQADYLQNNPLFGMALDSVNKATMSNRAARGKLGTGGTLDALKNNYLVEGQRFIQPQLNALFNAVNMGQSSAAGQANSTLSTGSNVGGALANIGDVRGAGIVGKQGAQQAAFNNLLNTAIQGGKMAMSGGAF